MSVRCGKCSTRETQINHDTVAEVAACFKAAYAQGSSRTLGGLATGQQELRVQPANTTVRPAVPTPLSVAKGVLHEGYFTIVFAEDDRITLRVRRQRKDSKFRPGELLVSYLSGSDNEGDYTGFAFVDENGPAPIVRLWKKFRGNERLTQAAKVLAGDPQAAALAYAVESGNCSKCNRLLTVPQGPKSQGLNPYRDAGLGPDCGERILG